MKEEIFTILVCIIIFIIMWGISKILPTQDYHQELKPRIGDWIDAYVADPILMANHIPQRFIQQRVPYNITYMQDTPPIYIEMIQKYILHADQSGKIDLSNLHIVVSPEGTTGAIRAFYYAVQQIEKRKIKIKSSVKPPYYVLHKKLTHFVPECEWIPYDQKGDIEIVISPNNPTGELLKPTGKAKYIILDAVYDKPLFTNQHISVNPWKYEAYQNPNFVEVSSFSKLGYAGVRVGYAVTSNAKIAKLMNEYFKTSTLGLNAWAMKNFEGNYDTIMDSKWDQMIYQKLQKRHQEIRKWIPQKLITSNDRIPLILTKIPKSYYEQFKIRTRGGTEFDISDDTARLNLMLSNEDWKEMIKRISSNEFQKGIKNFN
jgi:hypothetical protein